MKPHIATKPVLTPDKLQSLLETFPKQSCTICGEQRACLRHADRGQYMCLNCHDWVNGNKAAKRGKRGAR